MYHLWRNVCSCPFSRVIGLFVVRCRSSLNVLDINPWSDVWFANIFSHSIGCLFNLLCPVRRKSFQVWCSSVCLFLLLLSVLLVSYPRDHCQVCCHEAFSLFSSRNFIVLGLMLMSLFSFWIYFCIWSKVRVHCHSFAYGHPVFPGTVLSSLSGFGILVKDHFTIYIRESLFLGCLFHSFGAFVFMPVPCYFNYSSFIIIFWTHKVWVL